MGGIPSFIKGFDLIILGFLDDSGKYFIEKVEKR